MSGGRLMALQGWEGTQEDAGLAQHDDAATMKAVMVAAPTGSASRPVAAARRAASSPPYLQPGVLVVCPGG